MKSLTGKQFCKILTKKGWLLIRITGSHHIYRKTGIPIAISVPVHGKDLKIGLLKSLMKQAGLTEKDLD